MKAKLLVIVGLLSACGGEDAVTCSLESRQGTWLVSWQERSGSCGRIDSQVVIIDDLAGEGCDVLSRDISDDECRVTSRLRCVDDGVEMEMQGYVDQDGADRMVGLVTVTAQAGRDMCTSTYRVVYER